MEGLVGGDNCKEWEGLQMHYAPAKYKTAPDVHLGLQPDERKRVYMCVDSVRNVDSSPPSSLTIRHWRSRSSRYLYSNVNPSFFLWPHFS